MAARKRPTKNEQALQGQVVVVPSLLSGLSSVYAGLSPSTINNALLQADRGHPQKYVDLVHSFRRKSGHLHDVLQIRELALSGLPWDVVPQSEKPTARDKLAARECKEAFQKARGFYTMLNHLAGEGLLFGHSDVEAVWRQVQGNRHYKGVRLWPSFFVPVPTRRFGFMLDGRLVYDSTDRGYYETNGIDLTEQVPGKFVNYRPRVTGSQLTQEGAGRILIWYGMFENFSLSDWMQLAELVYKPKRIGKYKKSGSSKEDITILTKAAKELMTNGYAVLPDNVSLELIWNQMQGGGRSGGGGSGGGAVHQQLAEFLHRQMSKTVLGITDIVEPGPNGARSALEMRGEVRSDIRNADAREVCAAVTVGICEPFVRYNYGERVSPCMLVLNTQDGVDLKDFAEAVKSLKEAGKRIPEHWVEDKAGMPEIKKGDVLLGQDPESSEEEPGKPAPNDGGDDGDDDNDEGDPEKERRPVLRKGKRRLITSERRE